MTTATTKERAELSLGSSSDPIYRMVARAVASLPGASGTLVDVGCGAGNLWPYLNQHFERYVGVDVYRFDGFPIAGEFVELDLDSGRSPLDDGVADVVVAVETIEHLENPRALFRELHRICKVGGWVIVTTPNQLSVLSKLTLVVKNQFNAFLDSCYPAHITALLESDLRRIATECRLDDITVSYSLSGRIPGTGRPFPSWLSRRAPRSFSDNLLVAGKKTCN